MQFGSEYLAGRIPLPSIGTAALHAADIVCYGIVEFNVPLDTV